MYSDCSRYSKIPRNSNANQNKAVVMISNLNTPIEQQYDEPSLDDINEYAEGDNKKSIEESISKHSIWCD